MRGGLLVPEVVRKQVSGAAYMPGSEKASEARAPEAEEAGDLSSASSFLEEKPRTVVFGGSHALVVEADY